MDAENTQDGAWKILREPKRTLMFTIRKVLNFKGIQKRKDGMVNLTLTWYPDGKRDNEK